MVRGLRDMARKTKKRPLFDPSIVKRAIKDAIRKLDPRQVARNPVMFVVEIGSILTTLLILRDIAVGNTANLLFTVQVTLWLWFTVLFANFAEAMAEGRGKAQADTLRKAKTETMANLIIGSGNIGGDIGRGIEQVKTELVPGTKLRKGDVVLVRAGEIIPGDGEVIEGVASVDESAITGESAPVIREAGGDRSAVTGGTTVISDWIKVRITIESRRYLPGSYDRAGRGRRTAKDTERDRTEYIAGWAYDHLSPGSRNAAAVCHLQRSSLKCGR